MADSLITAVAALIGAVLGSGATVALLNWRFEKQRDQRSRRRELLDSWRRGVDAWDRDHPSSPGAATSTLMGTNGLPIESITYCDWFQTLAPYLKTEINPIHMPVNDLRREIHRIERDEWGLV